LESERLHTVAAHALLTEHIAGNPDNEEFVAAPAEYRFNWNASVGASQNGSKRGLSGHVPIPNAPPKGPRIERDDTAVLGRVTGVRHFRKVTIPLYQEPASLFRSLGHTVRLGLRGIEAIDEFEHGVCS